MKNDAGLFSSASRGVMQNTADKSWSMVQRDAGSPQAQYTQGMNDQARMLVIGTSREMFQVTASGTIPDANVLNGNPITIPLRNVGLNKRIIIEFTGTVAQGAAETQSRTQYGLANLCSNINVTDLSNYQRINTSGWHLTNLATLRRQGAYGAAFLNDSPVNYGSNYVVNNVPAQVQAAKNFRWFYELPLAYSDTDLRGAIYAAVVNATWQLQFTINPQFWAAAGADATLSAFQSSTAQAGLLTNVTYKVYQVYLDQLPFSGPNPILPVFDLATGYLIQNTNNNGLNVNQDFPIQYPNFRQILSTMFIYNNGGQNNPGTDLAWIGIQTANLVFIQRTTPFATALRTRNTIGDDLPPGSYCIETRVQPINTTTFGNMQLVLTPSVVNANANVLLGLEMLGIINQVANASSLAGS